MKKTWKRRTEIMIETRETFIWRQRAGVKEALSSPIDAEVNDGTIRRLSPKDAAEADVQSYSEGGEKHAEEI